jgi:diaminopimelate epimerase
MNFVKYSATGNDFLIFNESYLDQLLKNPEYVKKICCRRTGVGSDGILFFLEDREHDFGMRYLNADGGEVGMCGNGARSLVHYAFHELDRKKSVYTFRVIDKLYEASVANDMVSLRMTDYSNQEKKITKMV